MGEVCVVLTTVDSPEKAEEMAESIVRRRLAACVSIIPGLRSLYPWQGRLCREAEWMLVIKTRWDRLEALKEAFRTLHPYTVPEWLVLRVDDVGNDYARWLHRWLDGQETIIDD